MPGFPPPAEPRDRERHETRRSSGTGASPPVEDYRNAPLRQFNTRLLDPLHARYRHLVRALEDDGHRVSMNELVHAVLHDGPRTPAEARAAVRNWRRTLDPDP